MLGREMSRPFFSVIIPAYNVAPFLADTLESVYGQTWTDYEIIVVNDGSTDATKEVLAARADSRVRVVDQGNQGVSCARNRGIQEARGEYVAFLDGDDVWFPEHLMLAAQCLRAHPDVAWYSSRYARSSSVEEDKNAAEREIVEECRVENYFTFTQRANFVWTGSVVMRRELLPENLFPPGITHGEDIIAWICMAARYPAIALNPTVTSLYRQRPDSAMRSSIDLTDEVKRDVALFDCFQESFSGKPCPLAVRRHLSQFSLDLWLNRVMRSHWKRWLPLIRRRRSFTGWFLTVWLYLFVWASVALAVFFSIPFRIICFFKFKLFEKG